MIKLISFLSPRAGVYENVHGCAHSERDEDRSPAQYFQASPLLTHLDPEIALTEVMRATHAHFAQKSQTVIFQALRL